jgi:hypothetical protein
MTDLEIMKQMIERANLVYEVEEPTGHWSEDSKNVELETAIRLTNRDADLPEDETDEYSTDLILLFKPNGSFFGFDVG